MTTVDPQEIALPGARARVYRDAPQWDGRPAAAVGAIDFESVAAGCELLDRVAADLKAEGFAGLLGPMDGDTWHAYRVVTESDGAPPFVLEPVGGPHDLEAFRSAGFTPVSRYASARARLADTLGPAPATATATGIRVQPWDGEDLEALIGELYALSKAAFGANPFFKPIGRESFTALYRPILPLIDPEHVLFARSGSGDLVGFLFGLPDRPPPGRKPAAILKTYTSARRGVGHLLADSYHRRAIDLGFEEVIHALMHEDNVSKTRSAQHKAHIFRRYALMGRRL